MGKNCKQVLVLVLAVFALLFVMFPMTANAQGESQGESELGMPLNLELYDVNGVKYPEGKVPQITFVIRDMSGAEFGKFTTDSNGCFKGVEGLDLNSFYYLDISDESLNQGYFFDFDTESEEWNEASALALDYYKNSDNGVPGLMFFPGEGKNIEQNLMAPKNKIIRLTEIPTPISVSKVDSYNRNIGIAGVEFKMFKYNGIEDIFNCEITYINNELYIDGNKIATEDVELIASFTTDASGLYSGLNIAKGNYIFVETKPAETHFGMVNDEGQIVGYPFRLDSFVPEGVEVVLTNEAKCSITIEKINQDGVPMPNVEFALQIVEFGNDGPKYVDYLTGLKTNAEGLLEINNLHQGTYRLVETPIPGYKVSEPVVINLPDNDEFDVRHQVVNEAIIFAAGKIDANGNPMEGIEFDLFYVDENMERTLYGTYTSDEDGLLLYIEGMPAGNYVLVENNTPSGMFISDVEVSGTTVTVSKNEISFSISNDADAESVEMYIINDTDAKYSLTLDKYGKIISGLESRFDETLGEYVYSFTTTDGPIPGAKFELKALENIYNGDELVYEAGDLVETIVTTEDEFQVINGLLPGKYELKEVEAPKGYKLDTAPATIVISDKDVDISIENFLHEVTFVVKKTDAETGSPIQGAIFGIFAKEDIYFGNDLILQKDACIALIDTDENGIATSGAIIAAAGEYYAKEVQAAPGYKLSTSTQTKIYNGTTQEISFEFTNERQKGTIVISKQGHVLRYDVLAESNVIDWEMGPLEGVEFTIYAEGDIVSPDASKTVIYADGEEVAKGKTSADGLLRFENLPIGTYSVVETGSLPGYVTDTTPKTVTVKEAEESAVEFENQRCNYNVVINKTNGRDPLAGATFGIYAKNDILAPDGSVAIAKNALIKEFTSGDDGIASVIGIKLPYGDYVVREISAPEGYVKSNEEWDTPATDGAVDNEYSYEFTVINSAYKLTIDKIDKVDGSHIIGAKLLLYKDGEPFAEWTSNGTTWNVYAVPGSYELVETQAPYGYEIAEPIKFVIGQNEYQKSVEMKDDRSTATVNITKYEAGSEDKPVEDVTYTLKDKATGAILATGMTNSYGELTFGNVPIGTYENGSFKESLTYILEETSAPAGYIKTKPVEFVIEVSDDGFVKDFVVYNEFTSLQINKFDEDGITPLVGAHFKLVDAEGNVVVEWDDDDKSTYTITHLAPGTYKLIETKAPNGYLVTNEREVVITESAETVVVDIINIMDDYDITIVKTDVDGELLAGAKLELRDENGTVVDAWTSELKPHTIKDLKPGNYTIVEVEAPEGYYKGENVKFTLKQGGESTELDFSIVNDRMTISISKLEKGSGHFVNGAKLHLENEAGEVIYSWTSGDTAHDVNIIIPEGKYYIVEDEAPAGYLPLGEKVEIIVKETGEKQNFIVENDYTKLYINKFEVGTDKFVKGANMQLKDANGNIVAEWVVGDEAFYIEYLPAGEYTIVETSAPNGYVVAEPMTFTLKAVGTAQTVTMYDDYTKVYINKYEIGTETFIQGAKLHIENADGEIIDAWTTTAEAHYIPYLPTGEYKLVEDKAPDGYVVAEPITFTVKETAEKQVFTMYDDFTKVAINKLESGTNNKFVTGAKLHLEDANGTIIARWVSGDEAFEIDRLLTGHEYVIVEDSAPNGYVVSEPVKFTVENTDDVQVINMYDDYTKVEFHKYIVGTKDYLAGAKLEIVDANGEVIASWTTEDGAHKITHIPAGDYTLVEKATVDGYYLAKEMKFTVKATGETQSVVLYNEYTRINISKLLFGTTNKFVEGAKLHLEDANGKVITSWTTGEEAFYIEKLAPGVYSIVEDEAPKGYVKAEPVKIEVKATNEIQNFTMYNYFTQMTVSKLETGTENFVEGAKLHIEDENGNIIVSWTSEDKPFNLEEIAPGIYFIVEDEAPAGYVKAEPVKIEVKATDKAQNFVMYNYYTKLSVDKFETGTEKFVTGAKLHIEDTQGNIVAEWVVGDKSFNVEKLLPGVYFIVEDEAPAGYVKAEPVKIEVKATNDVQNFVMYNDYTKLYINKFEVGTEKFVEGAKLHIEDAHGNIVAEWVVGDEAHYIPYLPAGEYKLVEDKAADGYITAKPITFTVKATAEKQTVTMYDDFIKVSISKVQKGTSKFVVGAKLHLEDENGKVIASWTSENKEYNITHLLTGKYYIVEDEVPNGYLKAEKVLITVTETGDIQKFVMEDDYTKLEISKLEQGTTDKFVVGAKLHIEDMEGNVIAEWVTTDAPYAISHLLTGKYKLVEDAAPNGYLIAKSIEFEVKATGEIQKVEMHDDYTKIAIAKLDKDTDECVIGAKMHLEDAEGNIIAEWVTTDAPYVISHLLTGKYKIVEDAAPEGYLIADAIEIEVKEDSELQKFTMYDSVKEEDASGDNNQDDEEIDSPQTGDSSNLGLYFGLMFSSLIGIIALIFSKKRMNF